MDLIDRKVLLEALTELDIYQTMSKYQTRKDLSMSRLGISLAFDRVIEQPTVDTEPVRHGEWVLVTRCVRGAKYEFICCSECELIANHGETQYCPKCGAKMDGKVIILPTVDTMEVIRCKDCKYFGNIGEIYFDYAYPTCFCKHYKWEDSSGWVAEIKPDDGCSYGERRED